jgi:hypothetical protein
MGLVHAVLPGADMVVRDVGIREQGEMNASSSNTVHLENTSSHGEGYGKNRGMHVMCAWVAVCYA